MIKGKSFSIRTDNLEHIISQLSFGAKKEYQKKIKNYIKNATEEIFALARSKRTTMLGNQGQKVSDPSARFGVPVRTGALRSSIKREVNEKDERTIGRIYTDGTAPYDVYLEFGTSRMAPRPFMGDALREGQSKIKDILKK
jgi:HK97 gp10 family phage protein